ncbi:hypothetical protein GY21_01345 [Cryobacterium roopkundense]|uniref:FAD-binding PCMH-type domain-containing protein n=1 Tax=Cryobacterium roopkundense TaxID=1001240 RepID=A0A099JWH5_9MICO|nr:hypothetical protein GY21_01345 [Cryobacterium roopkundense]
MSRRSVLLAGGVAIVGWSLASGWVTGDTAHAGPRHSRVPRLDGTLEKSALGDFDHDFGGFIAATPWAVLRPGSTEDIATMIRFARDNRLAIAVNGQSGEDGLLESHSSYGQALTEGGIQIDARSFSSIHSIDATRAVVGAGATWAEVVTAALAIGSTVSTLPDYLKLSVGGTISVGGIGGNVQRVGLSADIVRSMEIVTGKGDTVRASAHQNADLFQAALAGGGQVGIITKVELELVPAESTATIRMFYYDDLTRFVDDQKLIMASRRFDHHSGSIIRNADDSGWRFAIELGSYHSTAEAPNVDDIVLQLGDVASDRASFALPYRDWAFRLEPLVPDLLAGGYWGQRKPWVSLLIPSDQVEAFLADVLPGLRARDLGAGFCLLSPLDPSTITAPLFKVPAGPDGVAFFFDLLAFPDPAEPAAEIAMMLERNRTMFDRVVALGGKRYIIGAVPRMTVGDWQTHFGSETYTKLKQLKRRYDPDGVLTPGQGFFR